MLQSIQIISGSGLVLFSKSFTAAAGVDRMFGALLRSLLELATQTTGAPLTHLETATSAIHITSSADTPLYCALFLDRTAKALGRTESIAASDVTESFGRVLGHRFLRAFAEEYGGELEASFGGATVVGAFKAFAYRIPFLLRDALRAVLSEFAAVPGLDSAVLLGDDGVTEAYSASSVGDMDEVALLSTIRPLLSASIDALASLGDAVACISVASSAGRRALIWRMDAAALVLSTRGDVGEAVVLDRAGAAVHVTAHLCSVMTMLRRTGGAAIGLGTAGIALDVDTDLAMS